MNLYLRFFNDEVLVENADQAIEFLSQLPDINMDDALRQELVKYAEGSNPYPKRFKIAPKIYFIVIKTTANNMEEFKAYADGNAAELGDGDKDSAARLLAEEKPGWYIATMKFKRVLPVEGVSNKFRYVDTDFEARLKAHSVQDCYNRVVDHLRTRADIDQRSQFPSIRGKNFTAEYLGMEA